MFSFKHFDSSLFRQGSLTVPHGEIPTPFFMPDATRASIRGLSVADIERTGVSAMVVNTFHLFLHPGMEIVRGAGGVHRFMNWSGPLLSDSGGYQVFSLVHKNSQMGTITEEGVHFRSPVDGSKHFLSPEKAIAIQFDLGVDMMVCFDDPPPNGYSKERIRDAVDRTLRWAERCRVAYDYEVSERGLSLEQRPLLFGVVQGGEHLDLRRFCAERLTGIGFDGYGFGARHVSEEGDFLSEVLSVTAQALPVESPRFALGVGSPSDIVRCASFGWDMFDCVIPTREGRHGRLFVWEKDPKTLSCSDILSSLDDFFSTFTVVRSSFRDDFSRVDSFCDCMLCTNHSRSYLRHLLRVGEPLGARLASEHNLTFYSQLMRVLRNDSQV